MGQANHAAAKAGSRVCVSRSLPNGVGGVRVNLIVPGFMETKMTSALADSVHVRQAEAC